MAIVKSTVDAVAEDYTSVDLGIRSPGPPPPSADDLIAAYKAFHNGASPFDQPAQDWANSGSIERDRRVPLTLDNGPTINFAPLTPLQLGQQAESQYAAQTPDYTPETGNMGNFGFSDIPHNFASTLGAAIEPIGKAATFLGEHVRANPIGGGLGGDVGVTTPPQREQIGQAAPFAAYTGADILTGGALTPIFGAQAAAQAVAVGQDYNAGKIDGQTALIELAQVLPQALPLLIHGAGALSDFVRSPEGRAVLAKLPEEGGGGAPLNPGGEPVKPGVQAGTEGADSGLPASTADNLPSPPETPPAVIDQHPIDQAALAATDFIRKAEKLRPEQDEMFAQQRRQQLATAEQRFRESGPDANVEARQAASGAFDRPQFQPLELSPEHDAAITHEINTTDQLSHAGERFQAHDAYDALKQGKLPQPAQLAQLGKVLGPEFEQAVLEHAPHSWFHTALEALGVSRALQATLDLSAALRQGIVGAVGHPQRYSQAFVSQIRALVSGDYAQQVHEAITSDPRYALVRDKVDLTALPGESKTQLTHREEAYQSQIAERIPVIGKLIKASDRAFSTFTNKFRHDLAYDAIDRYQKSNGTLPPEAWLDNLGKYVNNLTGRGTTSWLGEHAATVNAAFFSPKFLSSRVQLIGDLLRPSQSADIRMMAAKDVGSFVATGVGILAALKLSGVADVQLDPRSTDFGKYSIGGQRHDFWAGYGPIARLIAQEASGQHTIPSATHGEVWTNRDHMGAFVQFLRNKLSPIASLGVDISQGEPSGQDVNLASLKSLSLDNPVIQRVTPLFFQDAIQAYQQNGVQGAATGVPGSLLGESVSSYDTSPKSLAKADKLAVTRQLEDGGYNKPIAAFASPAWRDIFKSYDQGQVKPSDYKTLAEWKKAYVDKWGGTDPITRQEVSNKFDSYTPVKQYQAAVKAYQLNFWKQHPDLLQQAIDNKIVSPTKELQKLLPQPQR